MSVEVLAVQSLYHQQLHVDSRSYGSTLHTESSSSMESASASDSDAGYVTPVEHCAANQSDELHTEVEHNLPSSGAFPASAAKEETFVYSDVLVVEPELQEKIIQQVEWYFSDENLLKDSFLMKHINRNRQGYVSLKLVASLRKVKALAKDWRIVQLSVKQSTLLSLNEEETKIRRLAPPPQVDYSHIGHTILITNYPESEPNVQTIEHQFGRFGDVILVRILHPGRAIPLDVKPCKTNHPLIGKELCILVEYDSEDTAKIACQRFKDQQSWRDDLKVQLLDAKKTTGTVKDTTTETSSKLSPQVTNAEGKKKRKKSPQKNTESKQHSSTGTVAKGRLSKENSPSRYSKESSPTLFQSPDSKQQPTRKYTPPKSGGSPSTFSQRAQRLGTKCSPEFGRKRFLHPDAWSRDYASDSGYSRSVTPNDSPKNSPEPVKKFSHSSDSSSWRSAEKRNSHTSCIIRQPHGPDGTKGFHR